MDMIKITKSEFVRVMASSESRRIATINGTVDQTELDSDVLENYVSKGLWRDVEVRTAAARSHDLVFTAQDGGKSYFGTDGIKCYRIPYDGYGVDVYVAFFGWGATYYLIER